MKKLIEKFSGLVKGSITGFNRIVFKGFILPLMSAKQVMQFCTAQGVLNKEYKSWMMAQTKKKIIDPAKQYTKDNCGNGITHLPIWRTRKESLAHERQRHQQIDSGLIGVWTGPEADSFYRARYCQTAGNSQLQEYQTRCKHPYFYFDPESEKLLAVVV